MPTALLLAPPPDFETFLRPCVPMRTKRDRQDESIYIEMCMHTCDFLPTFNLVIARVTPCRAVLQQRAKIAQFFSPWNLSEPFVEEKSVIAISSAIYLKSSAAFNISIFGVCFSIFYLLHHNLQ